MKKSWNWRLWAGFIVAVLALLVQGVFFVLARGVLWISLALGLASAVLLVSGLRRAFQQRESYHGRVAGPILTVLSALILALCGFVTYQIPKHFAQANNAPRVGQTAPQFTLVDASGKTVSLATALAGNGASPARKAVLLVFYRGYW